MTDAPPKFVLPSEDGVLMRETAKRKRAYAQKLRDDGAYSDTARWEDMEATRFEVVARAALDPSTHGLDQPLLGRGGELVIGRRDVAAVAPGLVAVVEQTPDMLAADASLERLALAGNAGVLTLGVEMAESIHASNSAEQALAHQLAGAHRMVMKLLTASSADLESYTLTRNPHRNVEASRNANAAARLMDAFQRGMQTLERVRNGHQQVVTVQHVSVNDGGRAVVAGTLQTAGAVGV